MVVLRHATSAAAAGKSPRWFWAGSAAGQQRRAGARASLSTPAWFCPRTPEDAAGSRSTGKAIPARRVKRQGREPPDTASPTPGAPSSLSPGDSHITRSGWKVSPKADQQPVRRQSVLKAAWSQVKQLHTHSALSTDCLKSHKGRLGMSNETKAIFHHALAKKRGATQRMETDQTPTVNSSFNLPFS